MLDLKDITWLDLAPPNFRNTHHQKSLSYAIDQEFKRLITAVANVIVYSDIDHQNSDMLDALARQYTIKGYRDTMPLPVKRRLVKQAILAYIKAGTIPAVLEQVQAIFGDADIEEWFKYGGEPYYFRITSSNPALGNESIQDMISAIYGVKRLSAWLDQIIVILSAEFNTYIGFWLHTGTVERFKPMNEVI